MSSLLEELKLTDNLVGYWDFRKRSLLDLSGKNNPMSVTSGTPTWKCDQRGRPGIYISASNAAELQAGNSVGFQINSGTLLSFIEARLPRNNYGTLIHKNKAWAQFIILSGGQYKACLWSYIPGVAISIVNVPTVLMNCPIMIASVFENGTPNGSAVWMNGVWGSFGTLTIQNQLNPVSITETINEGLQGVHLSHAICNRKLTSAELSRCYNEWLSEGWVGDSPKTNHYSYPSMRSNEYTSKKIVFDTNFVPRSDGKICDLTNNYPGTITNVLTPGPMGEGGVFASNTQITHAAILPISQAPACSIIMDTTSPSSFGVARYAIQATNGVTDALYWLMVPGGAKWLRVILMIGGISAYGEPSSQVLRASARQHIVSVFNGAGATNSNRLKIFIDGEHVTLNFSGNIPVITPSLTAAFAQGLNPISHVHTCNALQIRTEAITPDSIRNDYLSRTRHIDWQAQGESTPVSLVASMGAGGEIGDWRIISGSARVIETSDGRRWLECLGTTSVLVTPANKVFGTWVFTVNKAASAYRVAFSFIASQPVGWVTPPQNAYQMRIEPTGDVILNRTDNGVSVSNLFLTALGYTAAGTAYTYCINRRASDGCFTAWIKGGAYTNWTLISAAVGGSNPTAPDATHTTSAWVSVFLGVGDRILIHDPNKASAGPTHYLGQLIPTLGELPDTSPQNLIAMSHQFAQAPWSDSGPATITVTDGVYASPGGTPGHAARLDILSGGTTAFITQIITLLNPGAQYTASVYVRAVVGTTCTVDFWDGVRTYEAQVDLTTGVITPAATGFTNPYCWTEDAGGGWWRICWSVTCAAPGFLEIDICGDNVGDVLAVDQAQLVQGPCAGAYRETQ